MAQLLDTLYVDTSDFGLNATQIIITITYFLTERGTKISGISQGLPFSIQNDAHSRRASSPVDLLNHRLPTLYLFVRAPCALKKLRIGWD